MIYSKEEFKKLWESDEHGGGITNDDCADCAKAWGLCSNPRCMPIGDVVGMVCKAVGVVDDDHVITEAFAWKVYNFINRYKACDFGFVLLQEALDKYFEEFDTENYIYMNGRVYKR